jgi:GNAT superfamily N-acetyltransferase
MSRPAMRRDLDHVVETVALAFADDPIWGPALRRSDGRPLELPAYWRLFVEGAARFGTVRLLDDRSAVSIWLPPGATELDDVGQEALAALLERDLDASARADLEELYRRFEASRASRPEHYYLSLLATHPAHRGLGRGQQLLALDLTLWDAAGVPSYLESTNPANDHRYERAGFHHAGGFAAVRDAGRIAAMWREVGGAPPAV